MPNYCNNDLTLTHTDPAMIAKAATALKEGDFLQTFVPVPAELLEATASFGDEYEAQNKANVEKYGYVVKIVETKKIIFVQEEQQTREVSPSLHQVRA